MTMMSFSKIADYVTIYACPYYASCNEAGGAIVNSVSTTQHKTGVAIEHSSMPAHAEFHAAGMCILIIDVA